MSSVRHDVIIVGAGLSGLAVARFLRDKRPELKLLLLESRDHPGGAIKSHSEEGYLAEWGAHGFLDNCLESRVLVHLAGLEQEVEKAPLSRFGRYICLEGRLRPIPQTPGKILRAPLVPLSAKLRVLADLWKKPLPGTPSVAAWVEHRFGARLLPFADAVFTGTYAGDIERLRIGAVMPALRAMEREHGSVIRGLLARRRSGEGRKKKKGSGLPAMTSFTAGMSRLPQELAAPFVASRELMLRTAVRGIRRDGNAWLVETASNRFTGLHLVLALPVNPSLKLLASLDGTTPPPLERVPEARIATVALGFDEQAAIPFGFGYLAPEQEQRFALGALFSSHMFPERAPAGRQLMEVLVGGRRHPERVDMEEKDLIRSVLDDLSALMDLPRQPLFARVLRPESGIPQLEEGYQELLAWRDNLEGNRDGLHICGFGWKGIGINDMAKEAWRVARRILSQELAREEDELKGIYF